ncbi:MAG: hypothetical protein V1913_08420 [Fibrobacterota bacterium]
MKCYAGILLFSFSLSLSAADVIPEDPYALLQDIPTFASLFKQKGLNAYSADAFIEGPICKTLNDMAVEKGLSAPAFIEIYTEKGFAFKLKNKGYPVFFRQIVNEMFTPVQAFDRVVALLESKRELAWFERFKAVTQAESKWIQFEGAPHIRLLFSPKTERCIEKREERQGDNIKVIETLRMTFILQAKTNLIRVMKIEQQEKLGTTVVKVEKKFTFTYQEISGRPMPSELLIEKDGKREIKFKAVYKQQDRFIVFSEKLFGYFDPSGNPGKVRISYDNYRFNNDVDLTLLHTDEARPDQLKNEAEAEREFNDAKEHIMGGRTKQAKAALQQIIKKYPGTSYAEQSRTLLEGLTD